MNQLVQRRALGPDSDHIKPPIIVGASCASHFGVDAHTWADVCHKTGTYFRHLSDARFDPSERVAKQLRLISAAGLLKAGRNRAEELGIPGIGLSPSATQPWDWWKADLVEQANDRAER